MLAVNTPNRQIREAFLLCTEGEQKRIEYLNWNGDQIRCRNARLQ
jgi:hypothetical protein